MCTVYTNLGRNDSREMVDPNTDSGGDDARKGRLGKHFDAIIYCQRITTGLIPGKKITALAPDRRGGARHVS